MERIAILVSALDYIEQNIKEEMKTEDIANACFCSKSALEKLFRCINHISVHDYIVRRKMTCAGRVLFADAKRNVLEVALEYGYSSSESFSRAFKEVWNCNPSEFRKKQYFSELFPKYAGEIKIGENAMSKCKNVDISELYDLFSSRKGCYFVCSDIKNLIGLNEISRKAGDLSILEALKRMNEAAGAEDYVFRIGADEFVMLTNSREEQYALERAEQLRMNNGKTIDYDGRQLPLSLHIGITKLEEEGCVKYQELFTSLHNAIGKSKA